MRCTTCGEERELRFFLPYPQRVARHGQCVFCMYNHYKNLANFLASAKESSRPDEYLENASGKIRKAAQTVTCVERQLHSLDDFKTQLDEQYMRPHQQRRGKGFWHWQLKCAGDGDCNLRAVAMEEEQTMVFQVLQPHSCPSESRNIDSAKGEIVEFSRFVDRLQGCLSDEKCIEARSWPVEYLRISAVYKQHQDELHQLEDTAIEEIWGMPCRWRRARGETNQAPAEDDLQRLAEIVRDRNCGTKVEEYVHARFYTSVESSYFQQRGYFLLLACAPRDNLRRLLEKRIQIMVYAHRLLSSNMFLLCYKRLNCTVLRNHAWQILFLLFAWRARHGHGEFPLVGLTQPTDSESSGFYDFLARLEDNFFETSRLWREETT